MELRIDDSELAEAVTTICTAVRRAGGRALVVGGSVRDAALGKTAQDIDIEVCRVSVAALQRLLAARFEIMRVGEAFGVLKIRGLPLDVSLPRRESKIGLGHKGFEINSDPSLSPEEAASRRDFTINALAYDPLTGEVIDPYNGMEDIDRRILRHTSEKFAEDPLRVLRGMQFAARFDLTPAEETVALCQTIEPEGLARERIYDEWKKLILLGVRPSQGLRFLEASGWIRYFPELAALQGCEQEQDWHPEGDVWVHTLLCMDAFAGARAGDEWEDVVVGFAVLCHDFGKPATTRFDRGRLRSLGHEEAGAEPTRSFLGRVSNHHALIEAVVPLVTHHLRPQQFYAASAGDAAIRRLARNVERIDRLVRVAEADSRGRTGRETDSFPAGMWLLKRAHELAVADAAPEPIVKGRHLIALGLDPGPQFSPILAACYEAQLDGTFATLDEGIDFARTVIEARGGRGG